MRLIGVRHLNGPNIYLRRPVTVARLELDELAGQETTAHAGFSARLTALLPGLGGHHCAAGRPGGFLDALARGTYFGHVTEHVALELSALAGREVAFGRTVWAGADGRYDVVMECPADEPTDSPVPRQLLDAAMHIVSDLVTERVTHIDTGPLARSAEASLLGVSTAAFAAAARRRDIPVRRVGSLNLLRLGYGCHRRLVWSALTDRTSAVGVDVASDKLLAKELLAGAGIPVAPAALVHSATEAVTALAELGAPVVVKPRNGNQGACVCVGARTPAEVAEAYRKSCAHGSAVIVEAFVTGLDYRVLVVDGRAVAAARLRPASVTGDGIHDVAALVHQANTDPRRGEGHSRPLTRIELDSTVLAQLAEQGLGPGSVPGPGQVVTLRRNGNLSTGGTSTDVTDLMHPAVAAMCVRAAAAVGLDVCGIDLRLPDIAVPADGGPAGSGAVIEVNASPGLRMHLAPSAGRPRDVATPIIDRLYPPGAPARIPIVSVTGTNGKTTTVRMISHILAQAGLVVGTTSTDGVSIGGSRVCHGDASGARSAAMVLDDPSVEVAVLETARGGIIRRGLGYDWADVAVITNITADHLGCDGIDNLDDLTEVKALVAESVVRGGTLVLNAGDPRVAALTTRRAVRERQPVIRFFGDSRNQVVVAHRMTGGVTCERRGDGRLAECRGGEETILLDVADIPGTHGGAATHVIANAMAAIAACRALGASVKDIRRALATFDPMQANPGRANIYLLGGSPVVIDYGHNPAALTAMGRFVRQAFDGDAIAAITLPGDRRNYLVAETAAAAAAWFRRAVIYEDSDLRGRQPGEMTTLIRAAMANRRPGISISTAAGAQDALMNALSQAAPGDPVLFLYEKLEPVRELLHSLGAVPWPTGITLPGA